MANRETMEIVTDCISLGSKITADGNCSYEIKRHLLLGRKAMTNQDSVLKGKDITVLTKICVIKAMVFLVVIYGCESWTVKKPEHWRIDAFELYCCRRLLRVPWTARRSDKSILKETNPEYSLEELMLKRKLYILETQKLYILETCSLITDYYFWSESFFVGINSYFFREIYQWVELLNNIISVCLKL